MSTAITFPASVGGQETTVMVNQISAIERQYYYSEHSTLVLINGRRVPIGCTVEVAKQMIRDTVQSPWLPQLIATAPKDGSEILAWFADGSGWIVVWWQPKGRHWSDGFSALREPSHWLHLPPAPLDGH